MGCFCSKRRDMTRGKSLLSPSHDIPTTPFLRIAIIGSMGVGKTAIFNRISQGIFLETEHTVRANVATKRVKLAKQPVTVQIFDMPSGGVKGVRDLYYEGIDGVIAVVSATDVKTHGDIGNKWVPELFSTFDKVSCLPDYQPKTAEELETEALADSDDDDYESSSKLVAPIPVILMRNKADATPLKQTDAMMKLVRTHHFVDAFSVSALNDSGIHVAVKCLLKELVRLHPLREAEKAMSKIPVLPPPSQPAAPDWQDEDELTGIAVGE